MINWMAVSSVRILNGRIEFQVGLLVTAIIPLMRIRQRTINWLYSVIISQHPALWLETNARRLNLCKNRNSLTLLNKSSQFMINLWGNINPIMHSNTTWPIKKRMEQSYNKGYHRAFHSSSLSATSLLRPISTTRYWCPSKASFNRPQTSSWANTLWAQRHNTVNYKINLSYCTKFTFCKVLRCRNSWEVYSTR